MYVYTCVYIPIYTYIEMYTHSILLFECSMDLQWPRFRLRSLSGVFGSLVARHV